MTERYDVLINGGGPVGMGLAIELGQRGIRTCVVERHEEPQPIPKGQNLTQRTCEHFAAWGCEDAIRAAHPLPEGAGIGGMTSYGTLLSGWHYDWLNRAYVRDYYFTANARLPQYATERVLRARAAELEPVTVHYGWTGTALAQDEGGVTLTAEDAEGDRRTLAAAYAVGCDGARSFTRGQAGISETRSDHDRLMALLVFRSEELHRLLERYPGKAFYNVLHPDYDGYWLFFGRVDHGTSWFFHAPVPLDTTRENFDFAALLYRAVGQPFALEFEHIGFWELRISLADAYRKGRVFIAGDAAHSHPPYGGYGINTGLEDVRNLGWKLAAALQGWGGPALLDSYEAERRPVFASTARDFIERFIADDRAFLRAHDPARDRAEFEAAWYGRSLDADEVNAFEPHYEGSPLVADRRTEETGTDGAGSEGTGPEGTGPEGTGPEGTGPEGTGPEGTGPEGTAPGKTRPEKAEPQGTGVAGHPEGRAPDPGNGIAADHPSEGAGRTAAADGGRADNRVERSATHEAAGAARATERVTETGADTGSETGSETGAETAGVETGAGTAGAETAGAETNSAADRPARPADDRIGGRQIPGQHSGQDEGQDEIPTGGREGGGDGPSARGSHSVVARPGHHLSPPDPATGPAVWAALGSGFTLLARDPRSATSAAFRRAAETRGIPFAVAALPEGAATRYGAAHVLVRPDTYIAWAGEEADAEAILARSVGDGRARAGQDAA